MTQQEYDTYRLVVATFFRREGLANLTPIDGVEYVASGCDCCGSPLQGMREDCNGFNPLTKEIQGPYQVCEDCIYFNEYGQLDDVTMMDNALQN